ncbi:MAG TPA: Pycsar system effector family protein [Candidatus Sulfotelmatobacter sp.]|nr:Pycsar system effector family protein [Candidatus Sulfotelmatobacter sp.]
MERFADWVKFQDAKAGGIAAIATLAAADLLNHVGDARKAKTFSALVFWLAVVAAVVTAVAVVRVWWPRTKTDAVASLYFWGRVASMSEVDYKNAVKAADVETIDDAVSSQAWELARITLVKTGRVRLATWAVAALVILWVAARALLGT